MHESEWSWHVGLLALSFWTRKLWLPNWRFSKSVSSRWKLVVETNNKSSFWNVASLDSRLGIFLLVVLVALLSYFAARLGATLEILPQADWPFWPGNVLVVSILLLVPRRTWPLLMAAAFASYLFCNLQTGLAIRSILLLVLSDSVEILTAALALSYFFDGLPQLSSVKALAKYSLSAGILAPSVAAIFGAFATKGNYWTSWRISFFSEAIAYFTVMPAILGWVGQVRAWARASRVYYLEATVMFAAVIFFSYSAFVARSASNMPTLFFFLVPFLLWSALRFGSAGAGTSATIVAFLSVWGAAHGRGPFSETAPINNVLWLQLFLLSTAVPFMVLAALVEERKKDEQVLRESEKRFRLVADTAPVLIWMAGTDKLCNFFNQGWLKFTNRTIEEELGEGWVSGVHPEDVRRCVEIYSTSFDARVDFEMEYRLRRFDGEYRWMVDYGVPRFESDGKFCGYIGSCVDITDRKTFVETLHGLTGRLIRVQDEERTRIARELHDDFSQRLALLGISLGQLWKTLPESAIEERAKLEEMLRGTKELSSDLHSLSHQLHSSKLEHVGLVPALTGLCKEISEKYRLEVYFTKSDLNLKIPKDVALCLFRITQEALGNVVKHSQATGVHVELGANAGGVSLRIRDDGTGFDTEHRNPETGIGLIGMQERIRLIGGRFLLRSGPRQGTEILVEVPLHSSTNDAEARAQITSEKP
jgi:PAS domain S-box-containing protein